MNINSVNYSPSFGKIYAVENGMGKRARAYSALLEKQIDYSDEVEELDKMGVDIVMYANPKNKEDSARVAFVDRDGKTYSNYPLNQSDNGIGKDFIDVGISSSDHYLGTRQDMVLYIANGIIDGTLEKSDKMTKTAKKVAKKFEDRNFDIKYRNY